MPRTARTCPVWRVSVVDFDAGRYRSMVPLDEPWESYERSRLPRGLAHAVGRDVVERALREAGARVDSLSFGPPARASSLLAGAMVFDVYWVGDGGPAYRLGGPAHGRLLMHWNAVPSASRSVVADELVEHWLPRACAWAAAAPLRGNVWSATDHRWMVVMDGTALTLIEDGPALG